jgi:hypothetical protein
MLTLTGGGRWHCEVPYEDWPEDEEIIAAIKRDFSGPWKDRRQEVSQTAARPFFSPHAHTPFAARLYRLGHGRRL